METFFGSFQLKRANFRGASCSIQVAGVDKNSYLPRKYVACIYDDDWFVSNIVERSDENHDILLHFVKKNPLKLPSKHDLCWVPFQHDLCSTDTPKLH